MNRPVAIITGAGSGIGAACARLLAARGHDCVLVGRRGSLLEDVRATLDGPEHHLAIAADVADSGRCAEIVDTTLARYGRVDALVLSAGVAPRAPIDRTTEEMLEECFFVNAFGPAFLISRAWPTMKAQRSGRIVIVSTLGTLDPFPGFFAYAASKSAADSLVRSVRAEGGPLGIRAFAVNPGCVDTEILRRNFPESVIPKSKTLAPESVAEVIVACATGERDADSGTVIPLPSP